MITVSCQRNNSERLTDKAFDIRNDIFRVEKHPMNSGKLVLTINRQPIGEWFKEHLINYNKS